MLIDLLFLFAGWTSYPPFRDCPPKWGKPKGASAGWRRAQWLSGRLGDAEGYAMLAVAAFETSHSEVAQLAVKQSAERGADMAALKQLFSPSKAD